MTATTATNLTQNDWNEIFEQSNKDWLEFVSKYLFDSDLYKDTDKYMIG